MSVDVGRMCRWFLSLGSTIADLFLLLLGPLDGSYLSKIVPDEFEEDED
jgi:hypothetical protein